MARQQARRRRRERVTGIALAVLGVVVAVVAAIAIASPKDAGHTTAGSRSSSTVAGSSTSAATSSPAPSSSSRSGSTGRSSTSAPSGSTPSLGSTTATAAVTKLPLVILNNTTTNGLATRAADRFRAQGWTVQDIGNLTDDILSSCAYYDPGTAGAKASADELRREFPALHRVAKKFDGMPSGPLVVVLTNDWPDA